MLSLIFSLTKRKFYGKTDCGFLICSWDKLAFLTRGSVIRKIIAICGAIVCTCILATQLFLYSPTELKAEQAEKRDETAGIEERVVQQEIGRLNQEIARLEGQLRQLMGSPEAPDTGIDGKDKSGWLEGALEPAGTASESDVFCGKTFHSLGDWTLKTGTAETIDPGLIVMWSGSLASIPAGWILCDGTLGTPDLRGRFIYGVASGENPGATGGSATHYHTVLPHAHYVNPPNTAMGGASDTVRLHFQWRSETRAGDVGGHIDIPQFTSGLSPPINTSVDSILPPYYKLAFIKATPGANLPNTGIIAIWTGNLMDIPCGWALCDGVDGRPDLRGKFILGVDSLENPGATGGSSFHHSHKVPPHRHYIDPPPTMSGTNRTRRTWVGDVITSCPDHTNLLDILPFDSHLSDETETVYGCDLPPYYEVAFIIRL